MSFRDDAYHAHLNSSDTQFIRDRARDIISRMEFTPSRDLEEISASVSSAILDHFKHEFSEDVLRQAAESRFSEGGLPTAPKMSTKDENMARRRMRIQAFAAMTQMPEYREKIAAAYAETGFNVTNEDKLVKAVTKAVSEGVQLGMSPEVGPALHRSLTTTWRPIVKSHYQDNTAAVRSATSRGAFER